MMSSGILFHGHLFRLTIQRLEGLAQTRWAHRKSAREVQGLRVKLRQVMVSMFWGEETCHPSQCAPSSHFRRRDARLHVHKSCSSANHVAANQWLMKENDLLRFKMSRRIWEKEDLRQTIRSYEGQNEVAVW